MFMYYMKLNIEIPVFYTDDDDKTKYLLKI